MKLTQAVAVATLFSMSIISCSKNDDQIQDSGKLSEKQLSAKEVAKSSATASFSSGGINVPIDVLVKYAIIEDNPAISEGSLTPSAELLTDLQLDELDLWDLRRAVEDFFMISITDENWERIKTFDNLVDFVRVNAQYDFSESMSDDMGRTVRAAREEALMSTSPISSTSVSYSSPTATKVPFTWTVVKHLYNQWEVKSSDEAEGYKLANGTALIYKITHKGSSFHGQRRVAFKPRGISIIFPLTNLDWEEKSNSTSIAADYKSGQVSVSGILTNYGEFMSDHAQTCTVRVH